MDKGNTEAIRIHAEKVSQQATTTMLPHLEQLVKLADMFFHLSVDGKPGLTKFTENLTNVVDKCLRLKINLCRSSFSHAFYWPAPRQPIDLNTMNCPYQQICSQPSVVAYTLLPGILITEHSEERIARSADVMARAADLAVNLAPLGSPMSTN
ncbi:hypothetical protein CLAFUW4_06729 [Fulvia fulva]|uniref:Uncharacterized protein n=1 Tax=Passalora fulva TaxID=5499 RepID=A0A9Q8PBP9_PASFU|nr:uncharacterized protein CLAFUR5_06872 [Fulvia fulva]KAK4621208.1 hypothetical protein CLAFUR4_06737 [Fulvia fulva]KAK4623127.1 hypothetical protein CLAFUR0_06732 [Fulvia fulva]UJO19535.1 hypothetical protein CLAFUR5_06872 [Fulvia fulva]WPV16517.1 hypothetical protein CLAFUW4_06729 [Fulvia fulva]WPV31375.1 hypothetical protein CLAFUW7_06728 [Fulvia fulva]